MTTHPMKMMMNEMRFNTRKIKTEYSHPGSL